MLFVIENKLEFQFHHKMSKLLIRREKSKCSHRYFSSSLKWKSNKPSNDERDFFAMSKMSIPDILKERYREKYILKETTSFPWLNRDKVYHSFKSILLSKVNPRYIFQSDLITNAPASASKTIGAKLFGPLKQNVSFKL